MNQWDIWTFDFPDAGPHPAIIVSHPDRVANASTVNILIGSTSRATRPARRTEILLDAADGLDWETLVRCDLMYAVEKTLLRNRRGRVTGERQLQISRKIVECFGFRLF
jgi:mRNA-degrading endonuclease toxin of MazEF toxin-antitoxin module